MIATPPEPRPATLGDRLRSRPVPTAIVLVVIDQVIALGAGAALAAVLPGLPLLSLTGPSRAFVVQIALAAFVLIVLAVPRWWRLAGFNPASQWRDLRLYALPLLLVFAPFVAGVTMPTGTALVYLCLGYLMTGFAEEAMFRGVILGLLRPLGVWPAVLASSLVFGLVHLDNLALRGVSVLILLQAFGAAVQGIGYAALRLRTNTIWPLIVIHGTHDLTLQLGQLPVPLIEAAIDTILLGYGIVLLRRSRRNALPRPPASGLAPDPVTQPLPGAESQAESDRLQGVERTLQRRHDVGELA
jgi:membrane protease YdiL (CAAX protease family)